MQSAGSDGISSKALSLLVGYFVFLSREMYVVPISQTLKGLHILQSSLANSKYFQFRSHSVKLKLSYREQNCPKNSVGYYAVITNYTIMSQSHLPQSHVLRLFNQFLFDMFNTLPVIKYGA